MITPAYALTATERVLPRLALDFTTASLDARVTVTRALNTATRTNSSGLIETVNADLPRFDFNPTTQVCRGLLIEETRANLLLRSQEFNLSWTPIRSSVSPNATTSPSGDINAGKLVEDTTASNSHFILQIRTATASTAYTYSAYFKAAGRTRAMLEDGGGSNAQAYFDLSNETVVSTSAAATASITNVGSDWYRCTMSFTTAGGQTGINARIYLINTGTNTIYTGDGVSGVFLWGAQLEAGAFATSYIPTTTTSLTRNADAVSMTGTNFSSWYNASEGSFVVVADTAKPTSLASSVFILSADDGTTANRVSMRYFAGNAEELVQVSSAVSAQLQKTYVANTAERFAMAYKLDSFAFAANGTAVVTDPLGGLPTVNQLCIGSTASLVQLNGHIGKLMYWPQRLTNAETQAFSK